MDAQIDCLQAQQADAFVFIHPIQSHFFAPSGQQILEPRNPVGFQECAPGKYAETGAGDKIAAV